VRIAQAIALFLPDLSGGATLVCRRLGEGLVARGHTVDIFSGRATPSEPTGAVSRGRVGALSTWRVNVGGAFAAESEESYRGTAAATAFADLLDATRPDVVHLHSLQGLGVGLIDEADARGVPIVLTMHDWWWLCPCLFRLSPEGRICPRVARDPECFGRPLGERGEVLARALAKVDRVLVPSAFLRDDLVAHGFDGARIEVQENGVPTPAAAIAPRRPRAEGEPLRIAFIGGAGNRAKGLEVLLEAAASLGPLPFRLRCHAVAAAEAAPWAERLGERLECRPPFSEDEIDAVIGDSDVVAIPSLMRESFSLVAREALARGLPVVTSDCGGPEEVVRDGVNGRVVRSGSAQDLARALASLVTDREEVQRLRPAPVPRFRTPVEHAAAVEAVYRDVVRARSRPRAAARAALAGRRFLFLTGSDGAPLRYRVWHLVDRLAVAGVQSRVLYHSDVAALALARRADALVLFRAPFSVTVAAAVAEARRRSCPVLFAVDDLVLSPDLAADAPALDDGGKAAARGFRETLEAYARSAQASDAFLGSTPELVDAAQDLGLPGAVERNRLGAPWLARVASVDPAAPPDRERLRVGYFSGTDTHDGDLEQIAEPLARALARFPGARLVLGGPLRVPEGLAHVGARIEKRPFVPWSDLPASLASVDVNLAPLDLSRRFNRAKSEVKYFEAASLGIPTIASPSPAFRCASGGGRTAWLADSLDDWEARLVGALADPEEATRLGAAARRDALRRYGPDAALDDLHEWFAALLERPPRATAMSSPVPMEAGGGSAVALEPAAAPYDAHQLEAERGDPLRPGAEVEQTIECRGDGLFRIDVRVGTYARTNRHGVVFQVRDDGGQVLATRTVPAERMVDRSFVAIELDEPLADSAGRTVRLSASAPDAGPDNEILLWRARSERGGLSIGGRPAEGWELSYRAFSGAAP
jgi:glycosyltransferase involved in cell wall biosynthesis